MNKHPDRWRILHLINLGTFMSTLDAGIVNVALPTMSNQFSISLTGIQWIITSYLLTMVALLPMMGKLSDRLNRSAVYSYGFLVFSFGSLLAALSQGLGMMIISRCIQGVGAAMIMANSQAMVREIFPDHERGKALGINAIIIALGSLSGPALGGIMLAYMDWPILFIINVPLGMIALILGLKWFPKTQKQTGLSKSIDIPGSLMLAAGTSFLLLSVVSVQQEGISPVTIWQWFIGSLILVILAVYESKIKDGILDKILLTNRSILTGNLSAFLIHLIQMASVIPMIFYMQDVLGYSTLKLGLILALQPVMMGVAAPFAGWYRDKYGAFIPLVAGPGLCAVSLILVPLGTGTGISMIDMILYLTIFGMGMGCFQATNNAEIMSAAPLEKASLVGSMLALIRYLGMIVGTALAALFFGEFGGRINLEETTRNVSYLFIVCFLFAAIVIYMGMIRPRKRPGHSMSGEL